MPLSRRPSATALGAPWTEPGRGIDFANRVTNERSDGLIFALPSDD